jgi:hypothetical protein
MQMNNKVELIKRLDEHDCMLTWSASAPATFIVAALEDFKVFIDMKIREMEDQKKSDNPKVESLPEQTAG